MKVIDLIIELEKIEDKNKEILLDFTKPGMEIFKMMGIQAVEEIGIMNESGTGEDQIVILTGMNYGQEEN